MGTDIKNLKKEFTEGLKQFLQEEDEEQEQALTEAYEQGRKSLQEGWGELDIINVYHQSLNLLQKDGSSFSQKDTLNRASHYLAEWLAPYEIRLKGYEDLIDETKEKNELLEEEVGYRHQAEEELRKNKQYFQSLIEHAQDVITVLGYDRTIQYVSPAVKKMLGYKQEELTGKDAFRYFHHDDVEKITAMFNELVRKKGQTSSAEFRFKHKNGEWIYLESIAKSIDDAPDEQIIVVNSRNVTKRKKAMRSLEEKSAQLTEAQRISKVGSWKWIPGKEKGLKWSKEMCRIYGVKPKDFDGKYETFYNPVHPDDKKKVQSTIDKTLKTKKSFKFEHRIVLSDNEEKVVLCRGHVRTDSEGDIIKLVGTSQDITEQKQTEEKLREYSQRLRKLSGRIESAREEERISVARQVHDDLGQMLSVLKMDISLLFGSMSEKIIPEFKETLDKETAEVIDRINEIIISVQRITTELRPEVLDDLGLKEAIDWQAKQFGERAEVEVSVNSLVGETDFLSQEQSTTIFRIFQEILTNIMRHAEATSIKVELKRDEGDFYLIVNDNGIGISQNDLNNSSSLGIIGMRERTQLLGGDVEIEGEKEVGTSVTIRIPMDKIE